MQGILSCPTPPGGILLRPGIVEILHQMGLLVGSQHQVHSLNATHVLRLQLGVAARDDDEGTGVLAHHAMDCLATLVVCNLSHRAGVDQADVSLLPFLRRDHTHAFEQFAKGRGF